MEPKKITSIGDLLISPPEQAPYESFSGIPRSPKTNVPLASVAVVAKPAQDTPQQPFSPPISPLTNFTNHVNTPATSATSVPSTAAAHDTKDPILYPEEQPTSPRVPLFERRLSPEAQNAVSKHMAAREVAPLPSGVRPPHRQDYELFLCFRETVYKSFFAESPAGRRRWLNREKAQLIEDAKARNKAKKIKAQKQSAIRPRIKAKPMSASSSSSPMTTISTSPIATTRDTIVAKTAGVMKAALGPRGSTKVTKSTPSSSSRPARVKPVKAPKRLASASPQPEKKKMQKEDKDFASLPDYCPPLSTLTADNVMSTPPASNARDFDDEDKALLHLLHPDELQVASNLRLDAATYLTSKRRIFLEKLHFYHAKRTYRKTHAQTACRIDVNKASKLHTAFASVGWLDDKWFENLPKPTVYN
ncbi:hypothetical protein M406DRAFT_335194 [Cryphonectria parasitica EP155]|uniref:SWIRM domain-containing protein n=1 Tax=Cryphonectria parasitica (strain ATCC 38755 / EP155) TaxID=660469 RepID=A0A9P4XQU3_CRYP1|nr:uncharacterized protein M406DRAFT_335194 [Cryphonectria parasitica EP155]KAF3759982.1 hypothetical protein M406DRAFT_335194 [Cryphonectria parasitica EP155]